jgi:hypothetical protein
MVWVSFSCEKGLVFYSWIFGFGLVSCILYFGALGFGIEPSGLNLGKSLVIFGSSCSTCLGLSSFISSRFVVWGGLVVSSGGN